MAEYIEREAYREGLKMHYQPTDQEYETDRKWAVGYNAGLDRALYSLHYARAADVAPVVHGRWVYPLGMAWSYVCSECGKSIGVIKHNYCPNCGARMDGDG